MPFTGAANTDEGQGLSSAGKVLAIHAQAPRTVLGLPGTVSGVVCWGDRHRRSPGTYKPPRIV